MFLVLLTLGLRPVDTTTTVDTATTVITEVECGRVQGVNTSTVHGPVYEYTQIPYAVAPVGERRWTHSELLQPENEGDQCWEEEIHKPIPGLDLKCVQYYKETDPVRGQEDCLVLSVRTPTDDPTKRLPVLVWIHGGSLMGGWADEPGYHPTAEFAGDLGVVTVNINYRLDLMGFFSAPEIWGDGKGNYGNFGIGDARTALMWVQRNIGAFGGDPQSVTLLGESSGAGIVMGLLVATDGLFTKAIALSPPIEWSTTYEQAWEARKSFVTDVNCTQETLEERRDCLKGMDIKDLIRHVDLDRGYGFYDFPMAAGVKGESMDYTVLEPTLVPFSPEELGEGGNWRSTPVSLILSNTAQEVGYNTLIYETNKVETWEAVQKKIMDSAKTLYKATEEQAKGNVTARENRMLQAKASRLAGGKGGCKREWWPQLYWDTLTTDIRATCPLNRLTEELEKSEEISVYRLYIKNRPDDYNKQGVQWDTVHGWDTEALFGYGWFQDYLQSGRQTIWARHQRNFAAHLRDLVGMFMRGEEIGDWQPGTTLSYENEDFPKITSVSKKWPQEKECKFLDRRDLLNWPWRN
uniref:Carboxylic ester hydrolase n=1 Tax=Hormiphora californensis TaxID=1403702 RepID=V9PPY2_HORCA|nr:carboxylesterase domain-containing protein [Hormiphora californensis]